MFNNLVGRTISAPIKTAYLMLECALYLHTCSHCSIKGRMAVMHTAITSTPSASVCLWCLSLQESRALAGNEGRGVQRCSTQINTPSFHSAGVDEAWEWERESIQWPSKSSDATSIPACNSTGWDGWRGFGVVSPVAYCNSKVIFYV